MEVSICSMWELLQKVIEGYSKYKMSNDDWKKYTIWVLKKKESFKSAYEGADEEWEQLCDIAAIQIDKIQKEKFK